MESNQNLTRPDELDLVTLVEKLISFLKNYGKALLLFSLLGLALGLLRYFISSKQYTSRVILHSVVLTNQEEIELIDSWQDLISKGEQEQLAKMMNCDLPVVKSLTKISAEEIQKLYSQNNPNGFIVEVVVSDTSILDELQNGIVHGLENSDYVRERVESRRSRLNELIRTVKTELAKSELTKNTIDSMIRTGKGGSASLMVDISGINSQWIDLNDKLLSYEQDLKFVNAVQVLQGFTKFGKPSSPSLVKNVLFGLAGGFFIGYLVGLFRYVQRRINTRKR